MLPRSLKRLSDLSLANPMPLWRIAHPTRRAAVSVILSPASHQSPREKLQHDKLEVLLIVRSRNLSYAGDVAFPGGKVDNESESPWDAAARETQEEVGIQPSTLVPVKMLPGYVSSQFLMVVPTVMWSEKILNIQRVANEEVYKVFSSPLSRFLEADGHHYETATMRTGKEIKLSHFSLMPSTKKVGDPRYDRVWGLTASILIDCGQLVFDKKPEFASKRGRGPNLQNASELGNHSVLEFMASNGFLQRCLPPRRSP